MAPEAWEGARLKPVLAFRLLAFRYPVSAWLDSLRDEEHRHPPARRRRTPTLPCTAASTPSTGSTSRAPRTTCWPTWPPAARWERPSRTRSAGAVPEPDEDALFRWFRQWVAAGIFQSVETA